MDDVPFQEENGAAVRRVKDALNLGPGDIYEDCACHPFELARWHENDEFRGFVQAFEKTLPLRLKSGLGEQPMVRALLAASHGVSGSIAEVLAGAARAAIRIGTERITVELIRAEAGLLTAAVA